jgi:hypothetical protein
MGIPVCVIDGSCSSALTQNLKTALVVAGPMIGGSVVWISSVKRKLTKKKKA